MRVLVVSPYAMDRPGGVQSACAALSREYADAGHVVTLVAPGEQVLYLTGLEAVDVVLLGPVTEVKINRSIAPFSLRYSAVRRVRQLAQHADWIHVHEPFAPMVSLGLIAAPRDREARVMATFHAAPTRAWSGVYRVVRPGVTRALRSFDRITAVSELARRPLGPSWGTTPIVPNGIDPPLIAREKDSNLVVFVGRRDERKGLQVLESAWPEVVRAQPSAHLLVVGARPPSGPTIPNADYLGRVDDAQRDDVLARAAILACPNLGAESFGIVPLEGMSYGCAIAASDIEPFRALVGDRGMYHQAGDADELARTITSMIGDRRSTLMMGKSGIDLAHQYVWSTVAKRYLDLMIDA